jgi:hypothetical protein
MKNKHVDQQTAAPHRRLVAVLLKLKGYGWVARGERQR